MSLRWKVLVLLFIVSVLLSATVFVVQWTVVGPEFRRIEQLKAQSNVERCTEALRRELEHLESMTTDWGTWDDTYKYVQDKNEEYAASNLQPQSFNVASVDLMAFVRSDGTMVWGEIRDHSTTEPINIPGLLESITSISHPLVKGALGGGGTSGVIIADMNTVLASSKPILPSSGEGQIRGAMIMGHLLDSAAMEQMARQTRVDMAFRPVGSVVTAEDREVLNQLIGGSDFLMRMENEETLRAYTLVRDVSGLPALLLEARMAREISQSGRKASGIATTTSILSGLIIMAILWVALSRVVVRPLGTLTKHTVRVRKEGNLDARLNMERTDEIGVLAGEFDRMVETLEVFRLREVEASRKAGKADVAAEVLHNVGNALNSVNVSSQLVHSKISGMDIDSLRKASQMLTDHEEDLGSFLANDNRGRQLPGFLKELSLELAKEQENIAAEAKALHAGIGHVAAIIQSQSENTQNKPLVEALKPDQILEDAVDIFQNSFKSNDIRLVCKCENIPEILGDRHKILHIMGNLFSNAVNALNNGQPDKEVILSARRGGSENVLITVKDNGIGISPENLDKVFAFGFTTRPDGHGFGLHSAANAAREMGGSLEAASDGVGKGSSFTLSLPINKGNT